MRTRGSRHIAAKIPEMAGRIPEYLQRRLLYAETIPPGGKPVQPVQGIRTNRQGKDPRERRSSQPLNH